MPILWFALFIAAWCLVSYINGIVCGWHKLARRFRAQSEFLGQTTFVGGVGLDVCLRFWADYSNIIRIAAEEDAFYISVVFPFRVGHPPLCIPRSEVKVSQTKVLWRKYLVLVLGGQEHIPMRISERTARKLGILDRVPGECAFDVGPNFDRLPDDFPAPTAKKTN
jgi:hypothetical protein